MKCRTAPGIALSCVLPLAILMVQAEQALLARGVLDTRDLPPIVGSEDGSVRDYLLNVWHWDGAILVLFALSVPCLAVGIWLIATRKRHTAILDGRVSEPS